MRLFTGETCAESVASVAVAQNALAATTRVAFEITVPGARVGDFVVARLNDDPEDGVAVECARVTADHTVKVWLYNRTAGALPATATSLDAMVLPSDEA